MEITNLVKSAYKRLKNKDFSINELAISMNIGKPLSSYDTNPQHIQAAKMLVEAGKEIKQGDIIRYVVINPMSTKKLKMLARGKQHSTFGTFNLDDYKGLQELVKPVQLAKKREIYIEKYIEYLEGTFEQLLDALNMDFDLLVGRPKQISLGGFFPP